MKKYFLLLFLFNFSLISWSQNFEKKWKEVHSLELKGLTKSALKKVEEIHKKARKNKSDENSYKSFFYLSKFYLQLEENGQQKIITSIQEELNNVNQEPYASLLQYVYAELLEKYKGKNWSLINKNKIDADSLEFEKWSYKRIENEIEKANFNSISNKTEVSKFKLNDSPDLFFFDGLSHFKEYTIFDFLRRNYLEKLNKKSLNINYDTQIKLYATNESFNSLNNDSIYDLKLKKSINVFDINPSRIDYFEMIFERVNYFHELIGNHDLYIQSIENLEKEQLSNAFKSYLKLNKAIAYHKKASKEEVKNYNSLALQLCNSILDDKSSRFYHKEVEELKNDIISKSLLVSLKKSIYENENTRTYVEHKNIDTFTIKYYQLNYREQNRLQKNDSLIRHFITVNSPVHIQNLTLKNKKDYLSYSSEVLLDKVPLGNYLAIIEIDSTQIKNQLDFQFIKVSNITVFVDENDTHHNFYLLDRNTGAPIQNAIVRNSEIALLTNNEGKVSFKKKKSEDNLKKYYYENYLFINKKDTLIEQKRIQFQEEPNNKEIINDDFEAKCMVFFDRGIYRPGQKVFYKGIMIQKKQGVKSVVPNLTVLVTIENADYDTVKEFTVTTNEFGSFSGEFEIPKNGVTGSYNLTIDDPYDHYEKDLAYYDTKNEEHLFWDYVDFDSYHNYNFQVEEYKKPTFEITFNTIKENLTYDDVVSISGNAKTLAGSNLTGATVKYSLSKYYKFNTYSIESNKINTDNTLKQDEIKTDENGNFIISWKATTNEVHPDSIKAIYYALEITVVDVNGETITANKDVIVSKTMLELKTQVSKTIFKEEKNYLIINTTTLNNYPIYAKGTIKVFYLKEDKKIKDRQFNVPEIQTIPKETFEKLFPLEHYTKYSSEEIEIKSIPFDTAIENNIDLSFLKDLPKGKYIFKTTALDNNENVIRHETQCELKSKIDISDDSDFFTFKNISVKESDFYEIEFSSVLPKVHLIASYYEGLQKYSDQIVSIINGKGYLKIKKEKRYKEPCFFKFIGIYDDILLNKGLTINDAETDKNLIFETLTFRNKIEPGSTENWSFKILDQKLESEVLASMYDTSIDQFIDSYRNTDLYPNISFNEKYNYPNYITKPNSNNIAYIQINYRYGSNKKYFFKFQTDLNWFGLDFNNPKINYENRKHLERVELDNSVPKNAKLYRGVVSDAHGPLPSANVSIAGTTRGVTTDFDGNYSIYAARNEKLVFSFVGMQDAVIITSSETTINVILEEGVVLDEIVLVGIVGVKRKSENITSSYRKIDKQELNQGANPNAVSALAGKVSGLQINTTSSGNVSIVLRGSRSISGSNEALIIIDGEISTANELKNIDMRLIESVTVLKSGEATAIYGEKGANGVLLVITSRGMSDLAGIEARSNFNETAFFYPHLKTDKNGHVSFNFTTPDNLTTWRLRLLAHDKSTTSGNYEREIISQKELMVMPNLPRFVREKDKITLISRVVNLSSKLKNGIAALYLFDATTGKEIDAECMNITKSKNFSAKAKQTTTVSWSIIIPEGISGLHYKIIAKSGNISDGEENIIPVLSNRILVTESKPIWLRENSEKEYIFENLKNASTTLKNHQFTIEYTSNPIWFAIQSLPYLLEYEHECAEQTFARYYANAIAKKIISSNPKIEAVFEKWKKESPPSKLKLNEELKSVLLAETPWFFDAKSEDEKNKKLALLLDLEHLRNTENETFQKLKNKQLTSGGFAWFDGGKENRFITQHILAGLGHLNKLIPEKNSDYKDITKSGIIYLDKSFNSNHEKFTNLDTHYLYTRSFYLNEYPITRDTDSIIRTRLFEYKKNWLTESIYNKAQMALMYNRYGDSEFAKKIIAHLKETSALNEDIGMYWIANTNSFYWHQSAIETQALLIEAFAEVTNDFKSVDAMKVWLIKQKQQKNWPTTKSTSEAIYALLLQGSNWTNVESNIIISIGNKKVKNESLKNDTGEFGYTKFSLQENEISKNTASIGIKNNSKVPGYGGIYWQYFENIENIKASKNDGLTIKKELFKKIKMNMGDSLQPISSQKLFLGDLITIRLTVSLSEDLQYLHLKDLRATCFEPVDVISNYYWNPTAYYKSTRDVATHFFFDSLKKGDYTFEYDVRVNNAGEFNDGIATFQSMYAPEFNANSTSFKIKTFE